MVSADDFLSIEKVEPPLYYRLDFKWKLLGTTVFGGIALAIFQGLIAIPLGIGRALSLAFSTIADRYALLIRTVVGDGGAFEVAWAAANAEVVAGGLAGFTLAIAVVLPVFYIASWGVRQLG